MEGFVGREDGEKHCCCDTANNLARCTFKAVALAGAELELVGALRGNVGAGLLLLRQGISDEAEHGRGLSASGGV